MKRILSILLALALLCTLLPAAVLTAGADIILPPDPFDDIVSGVSGTLKWELNKTSGVLTVSGAGEMSDAPWLAYSGSIRTVVIGDGVTNIGYGAFQLCTRLTGVTIPDSVTSIDKNAFAGCNALKEITIPESVTAIGSGAFAGCTALADVYYGGIEAKWDKIAIGDSNDCLTAAELHCAPCPHANSHSEHKNATCTESGYDRTVCDDCGEILSEKVLPALGHDLITDSGKPATCTEDGLTEARHCSRCDYVIEPHVIPALGHDWDEGKITTPATATANGVKTFTCKRCGETKTEVIPATGGGLKNPFVDVKKTDYFYDAVLWAYNNGVTTGTDATHFGPAATCTRGQIVTFLWRALGEPAPTITKNPFVDVKVSDYYYKAVLWAYENGVTTGTDSTHFAPGAYCKREHAVAFLYRAAGKPEYTNKTNPFSDVTSSAYYYDAVLWAVEKNITKGMDATHFGPSSACQRSQIVTFLYRFMNP